MSATLDLLEREETPYPVTIAFGDKEDADAFFEFLEKVKALNNAGSSRTYGVVDPSGDEKDVSVDLDGDGHTRVLVVSKGY
jgi:hypothetical protein